MSEFEIARPSPSPAVAAVTLRVRLLKWNKKFGDCFLRHADACVGNDDVDIVFSVVERGDAYVTAVFAELDSVAQNIPNNLLQSRGIRMNVVSSGTELQRSFKSLVLKLTLRKADQELDQCMHVDALGRE